MSYSSKSSSGAKPHKGINLTQVYPGKNNTTSKITGNTKLGSLQTTSKVNGCIRRLPNIATLPSLKSESSGSELTPVISSGNNGWNKQQTTNNKINSGIPALKNLNDSASFDKNTAVNKSSDLRPRWAKVTSTTSNDSGIQINGHQENIDNNSGSITNAPLKEFPSLADSVGKQKGNADDTSSLFPEAPPPSTAIGGYIRAKPVSYKNERKLPDRYCATTKPYSKNEKFDLNKKLAEVRVEEERRKKEEIKNCIFSDDQKGDEKENSEMIVEETNNSRNDVFGFDNSKGCSYSSKLSTSEDSKSQNGYESYGYTSKTHNVNSNESEQDYQFKNNVQNVKNENEYYNQERNNGCRSRTNSSTSGTLSVKGHQTVRIAKRGEDFGKCQRNIEEEEDVRLEPISSVVESYDFENKKNMKRTISKNEKNSPKMLQNISDIEKNVECNKGPVKPAVVPSVNVWAKRAEEREQAEKERLKQLDLINAAECDNRQNDNKMHSLKSYNDDGNMTLRQNWKNKESNKKNINDMNYHYNKRYNKEEGYVHSTKRLDNKKDLDEKDFDNFKRHGNSGIVNDKSSRNFNKTNSRGAFSNKGKGSKQYNSKRNFDGNENIDIESDSSEIVNYGKLNKDGVKATYYKRDENTGNTKNKKQGKGWNQKHDVTNEYNKKNNDIKEVEQESIESDATKKEDVTGNVINNDDTQKDLNNIDKRDMSEQDIENLKTAVDNITDGDSSLIPTTWSNGDNFDENITIKNSLEDCLNDQLNCSSGSNRINYDPTNNSFGVDSMNDIFDFPDNSATGFEPSFPNISKNNISKSNVRNQAHDNGRMPIQSSNLQQTAVAPTTIPSQQQDSINIHPSQGGIDVFGYGHMNMLMTNDPFGRQFQTQYTNYNTNTYSQGNNMYYDPRQNNQWNSAATGTNTYNIGNNDSINNRTSNNNRNNVGNQQHSSNYSQQIGNRQQRNNNTQHQQYHFMPTFPSYTGHEYFRNQPAPPNVTMNYSIPPTEINSSAHPYGTMMPPMLGSQNYQPSQYQFAPPIRGPQQLQNNSPYNNQRSSHGRQNSGLDDITNWNMLLSSPNMIPSAQIMQGNRGNGQNSHYSSGQQNMVGTRQNFPNNSQSQSSSNQRNNSMNNRGNSENNSSNRWNSTSNSTNNGNKQTH
uniref:BAT2_N domain-containing protein n=1 Tax=Parastrongyloides trichosuri TaxID=131310 RepID=A0A0N4ZRF0_PARTI